MAFIVGLVPYLNEAHLEVSLTKHAIGGGGGGCPFISSCF